MAALWDTSPAKDENEATNLPFWQHCDVEPLHGVLFFPFKRLCYKASHYLSGCNGAWHSAKRFSLHSTAGCRKVVWGSCIVDATCMVSGGLSMLAFHGSDPQSDKHNCHRLFCGHCPRSFDDFGCRVHIYVNCLISSSWTASAAFTVKEQAINL